MKYCLLTIVFCFTFLSCNKTYKDRYYPNGDLKSRTFYKGKNEDSIISYSENKDIEWIKKIYSRDSLYLWDFVDGHKVKEGLLFKGQAIGKWNFYKKDHLEVVREYVLLDGESYFNQDWHFSESGDTLKDKGNYFKITHNDSFKTNRSEIIRFFFEKPTSNKFKNEMVVSYDIEFIDKNNDIQMDSGEILGVNNEVLYEAIFEDEGVFKMKGYILETYRFVNDSTSERITRNRKLYFDETIKVTD